jgi:hypothetical protein
MMRQRRDIPVAGGPALHSQSVVTPVLDLRGVTSYYSFNKS